MNASDDANGGEIDRLKADVARISAVGEEAYTAAAELLVEWGNMPAELTDKESEMMVDAVSELTRTGDYAIKQVSDDPKSQLVSYFLALLADAWRLVQKRKKEPMSRRSAAGRPRDAINDWAYEEYTKGRSIDDILPDYIARRDTVGEAPHADPRESLRQAIETRKAKETK